MSKLTAIKKAVQAALVTRGYDLGKTGPAGNGVDGMDGELTWLALRAALVTAPVPVPQTDGSPVDLIDAALLKIAAPAAVSEIALEEWVEPIKSACRKFEINTIRRIAAFVTTLGHEGGFKVGARENMNYSAERMSEVWPSRFRDRRGHPNALAKALDRKPEEIANHVYANRMGNGPPESGDGWAMRGNGPIQLTGRDNHEAFAEAMGMTLAEAVAYIGTLAGGIMSAAWFWEENDVNRLADTPGVSDETRRINGGTIGLSHRKKIFDALVARLLELERGR